MRESSCCCILFSCNGYGIPLRLSISWDATDYVEIFGKILNLFPGRGGE
ncbi:hypothetical protein F0726_01029 [Acidithiobacillus caldus]|nr:hypothetical protein F0726_01029 [Acidithiobacillus caldus]